MSVDFNLIIYLLCAKFHFVIYFSHYHHHQHTYFFACTSSFISYARGLSSLRFLPTTTQHNCFILHELTHAHRRHPSSHKYLSCNDSRSFSHHHRRNYTQSSVRIYDIQVSSFDNQRHYHYRTCSS